MQTGQANVIPAVTPSMADMEGKLSIRGGALHAEQPVSEGDTRQTAPRHAEDEKQRCYKGSAEGSGIHAGKHTVSLHGLSVHKLFLDWGECVGDDRFKQTSPVYPLKAMPLERTS